MHSCWPCWPHWRLSSWPEPLPQLAYSLEANTASPDIMHMPASASSVPACVRVPLSACPACLCALHVGAGAASLYVPRYIAEVSPPPLRGRLGSLNQVCWGGGVVVSLCVANSS